jgi:hypothetical protein
MLKCPFQYHRSHSLGQLPLNYLQIRNRKNRPMLTILGMKVRDTMFPKVDRNDDPKKAADFGHKWNSPIEIASATWRDLTSQIHVSVAVGRLGGVVGAVSTAQRDLTLELFAASLVRRVGLVFRL